MNNQPKPVVDGQAPARRIGYLIAFVVILCGCLSLTGIWLAFNKTSVETLQTSFHLQSNGVTTTGTVVDLQENAKRPNSNTTYYFFVEFVVDGETYRFKSNQFYPARNSSWIGEIMPVIYDPADPNTAQIDTFEERWFYAFLSLIPF